MMGNDEQVRRSNPVSRTHQIKFLVPGQVTKMDNAKIAKRNDASNGLRVLGPVNILSLEPRARRILTPAAGKRGLDDFTTGRNDSPVESCNRNSVTGLH